MLVACVTSVHHVISRKQTEFWCHAIGVDALRLPSLIQTDRLPRLGERARPDVKPVRSPQISPLKDVPKTVEFAGKTRKARWYWVAGTVEQDGQVHGIAR